MNGKTATPHDRAGIATLSGTDQRQNRDRKARLIDPRITARNRRLLTLGIRNGIGRLERQGRASPRRGQEPNLTAKRKTSQNTPAIGAPLPTLTRSRIARLGRPET